MSTTTSAQKQELLHFIAEAIALVGGVSELARIAGVSDRTVYAWKNGERHPSRTNLERLTAHLEAVADGTWYAPDAPRPAWQEVRERLHDSWSDGGRETFRREGDPREHATSAKPASFAHADSPANLANPEQAGAHRTQRHAHFPPFGGRQNAQHKGVHEGVSDEFVFVEKAQARPSAGGGSLETSGQQEESYAFRLDWILQKTADTSRLKIMEVMGRSMETTLHNGDLVLINENDRNLAEDRIYVVRVHDEIYVKRFSRTPGKYLFRGDNRELEYQDITIDVSDESFNWEVIGRVIWAGKEF